MMKLKRVAFAGITTLAFSQIAIAGGGHEKLGQGTSEPQITAPGVEQDMIKQAQEKLSSKGHDVQADGVLGPKTEAAVKEFQQKEGIQASGRLTEETLAALGVSESASGAGSSSPSNPSAEPQS